MSSRSRERFVKSCTSWAAPSRSRPTAAPSLPRWPNTFCCTYTCSWRGGEERKKTWHISHKSCLYTCTEGSGYTGEKQVNRLKGRLSSFQAKHACIYMSCTCQAWCFPNLLHSSIHERQLSLGESWTWREQIFVRSLYSIGHVYTWTLQLPGIFESHLSTCHVHVYVHVLASFFLPSHLSFKNIYLSSMMFP